MATRTCPFLTHGVAAHYPWPRVCRYDPGFMKSRIVILAALVALVFPATACKSKLETGYVPVKLNASPQQRRAFYAAPFSPEARAAPDREEEINQRRPRPGL